MDKIFPWVEYGSSKALGLSVWLRDCENYTSELSFRDIVWEFLQIFSMITTRYHLNTLLPKTFFQNKEISKLAETNSLFRLQIQGVVADFANFAAMKERSKSSSLTC